MFGEFNSSKYDVPIPHRNWRRALAESFYVLSCASPGEVVCITGPSRAGKSLMIRRLIQMLFGDSRYEQTGHIPALVVEAANTGSHGTFSTKAFIQRMLEAVKHPLFSMRGQDLDDILAMQKMDRSTEATLRIALEHALIARGVKYLFIDEAQHVKYASKDTQAAFAVMDSWKCLAQSAGLVIVFVGAYPILDILANSPHLVGRKHQVHFPRYHATSEDIGSFAEMLQSYSTLVDLDSSLSSLIDVTELLYEGSLGCIGLLKAWLKRTDAIAMINGRKVDANLLRSTRLTDLDLKSIKAEIISGEDSLKKSSFLEVYEGERKVTLSDGSNRSSKPFQRKPTRETARNRTEIKK
ncbi:ATP-binding protein [Teredinibacter turnerae]|uniref:ATP-binding protein n=1 Tax=Teredinibacter turnerae TaxID=2426 RepID=UPI000422BA52|nr:ATP-binding protein [Teredinibacter turnerae]